MVCEGTTLNMAKMYGMMDKVAVLNFANPVNPGGGVTVGAMAQEECLCRSSNLYKCISHQNVYGEYYAYHQRRGDHLYSDRLIYTENVVVFKNDDPVPSLLPKKQWFQVDVITCAAPYLQKGVYVEALSLLYLFKSRIKNIFEAAREHKVKVIVLGAFGCGAFHNPPEIVAEAFRQVIQEENYLNSFKTIVFAIKPTGDHCPNLEAFRQRFFG